MQRVNTNMKLKVTDEGVNGIVEGREFRKGTTDTKGRSMRN